MNRRSAIATAGGVVASFVAGMAAVSLNAGGSATTTAAAAARPAASPTARVKPIIKHRTVVVHKKAKAPAVAGSPGAIVLPAPGSATRGHVTMTGGSAVGNAEPDEGSEHESGGDD